MSDDPYKNLSDELLDHQIKQGIGDEPRKRLLAERQRRRDKKDKDNKEIQDQIENDTKDIKFLTAIMLMCTIIILIFSIIQFFKK